MCSGRVDTLKTVVDRAYFNLKITSTLYYLDTMYNLALVVTLFYTV